MIFGLVTMAAGLVLLTAGADRTVVAAARLSRMWGVPPVLVGALVVGLGTSAPELVVSVLAAGRGEVSLAMGNVIGSNIANVSLVLGVAALIAPLVARFDVIRREGLLMLAGVVLLALVAADLRFERWEAAALLAGMGVAVVLVVRWGGVEFPASGAQPTGELLEGVHQKRGAEALIGVVGLAGTLIGAELLVRGALRISTELELSTTFVGLTLVAIGTSLPELATSIAAVRRRETELVVGNVLGSNLFNSLAVAGTAGLVGPGVLDPTFRPVSILMVATAMAAGFFAMSGRRVARWEAVVLLGTFGGFLVLAY